jgi:tRNA(Ile)-lysidine synthetase-like protein
MNITHTKTYKTFLHFIKQEKLDDLLKKSESKILVGVSGGSDSVFLLLSLFEYLNDVMGGHQNKLGVAHINYSLRGEDSKGDQLFVSGLCNRLNLPFYTKTVGIEQRTNLEAKCRDIRFKYFNEICQRLGYNVIGLAHNLEDRIENILIRLVKGGSLESIIQPLPRMNMNDIIYIRPLLSVSKKSIEDALNRIGQGFRIDVTNYENIYLRNSIRNRILPILSDIKSDWRKSAVKLLKSLQTDNEYINSEVFKFINKYMYFGCMFKVPIVELIKLHISLRNRIIIGAIKAVSGYLSYPKQESIKLINDYVSEASQNNQKSGSIFIYYDKFITVQMVYDDIIIKKKEKKGIRQKISSSVNIDNVNDRIIQYNEYIISFNLYENPINQNYKMKIITENKIKLYINVEHDCKYIRLRRVEDGDRIKIGKGKSKSINKILGDMKVPLEDREKSFIIETSSEGSFDRNPKIAGLIINNYINKCRVSFDFYILGKDRNKILELDIFKT